jgi:DNA-binding NarL/FixJ family response regulator
MSRVLRFPNSGKRRVVRRVIRRGAAPRVLAPRPAPRQAPARVLKQPIARRVKDRSDITAPGKIAIYANFEFNHEIHECLDPMDSVMIAGTVENMQSMVAMTAMSKADLAIVELECGGEMEGLNVARAISANSPATGIMIYTPALNPRAFKALWVYGSEKWSIITRASLANPSHVRATVKSAVRGLTWTEPGVQRQWSELGDRPRSEEDRRILMRSAAA